MSDKPLNSLAFLRMKQFRAMNKLKKLALKVYISPWCVQSTSGVRNELLRPQFPFQFSVSLRQLFFLLNDGVTLLSYCSIFDMPWNFITLL